MAKYRKKPIIIDAIQWIGDNYGEIQEFTNGKVTYYEWFQYNENGTNKNILQISTREGKMEALKGDFIIKISNNEFSSCKPDIFEKLMK